MSARRRTLSDSEARWEAVVLIEQATHTALSEGVMVERGEAEGWTEADMIAVEQHAYDRCAALVRRKRKAP